MNIVGALLNRSKSANPYAGQMGYGAPFVDAFNKNRAPSPIELIRENLGTAYACATLNADLIASTPLRLYVKTRKGESKSRLSARGNTKRLSAKSLSHLERRAAKSISDAVDLEEVKAHPVLDLLQSPNSPLEDGVAVDGFGLSNFTQSFQEVVGRVYWYVEKNGVGNTPSAIWIMTPQRMTEMPGVGTDAKVIGFYQFAGGSNGSQRYETDEIIPFRMPDLHNVYTGGMPPLRACFEQVRLGRKVDAHTNATLDNGGRPSAIWAPSPNGEMGGFLGTDEAARAQSMFKQAFGRAGNGGVMVQEYAGTLQMLDWPVKDIIDAARYELSMDAICAAFQVPVTKIKRNDANRASAQTGDYAHAKDAGLPRLRRNAAVLNQFLVPMYGPEAAERLFFAYDDPEGLHDDAAEKEEFSAAAGRGSVLRNEERTRLGLEPAPWGDQPLAPNTMIAVDPVTGVPQRPAPSLSPDTTNAVMNDLNKGLRTSVKMIAARLEALEKKTPAVTPESDPLETVARDLPKAEQIVAVLHRAFGEQRRAIVSQIQDHQHHKSEAPELPAKFIALDKWDTTIAAEARPVIEVIMRKEGEALLTRVGASPDTFAVFEKNIPQAAQKLSLKFAESTNETTSMQLDEALTKLRSEISEGLTTGDMRAELTNRVTAIFDQADTVRAETIARTEGSRAAHAGELSGATDSKVVSGKYWIASGDACEICDEFSAMGVIPLDQNYGADDYGAISAPPGHPRCQCSQGYSILDDQT